MKTRFDATHESSRPYERGELVLVSRKIQSKGRTRKLLPKFIGPFQVARQKCENTYLVEDIPALQKRRAQRRFNAHVDQMRPYRTPTEMDWRPDEWSTEEPIEILPPLEPVDGEILVPDAHPQPTVFAPPPQDAFSVPDIPPAVIPTQVDTRAGRISIPPQWHQDLQRGSTE